MVLKCLNWLHELCVTAAATTADRVGKQGKEKGETLTSTFQLFYNTSMHLYLLSQYLSSCLSLHAPHKSPADPLGRHASQFKILLPEQLETLKRIAPLV